MFLQPINKNILPIINKSTKNFASTDQTMPLLMFQENMEIINKSSLQFESFLSQVKIRRSSPLSSPINLQPAVFKDQILSNSSGFNIKQSVKQVYEKFYQKQSKLLPIHNHMQKSQQILKSQKQIPKSPSKFSIRKLERVNPSPDKFIQEENIRNQHPSQLIVLKSANDLPHWLFDSVRQKNASRLKNLSIQESQQKNSPIVDAKINESSDLNKANITQSKFYQRHFNQACSPTFAIKDKCELNPQYSTDQYSQERSFRKTKINSHNKHDFRKISSSVQMRHTRKSFNTKPYKSSSPIHQIHINEYEYSYCPEDAFQNKRQSNNSANRIFGHFVESNSNKINSGHKSRVNQYRIWNQKRQKHCQKISESRTPSKRLPTVSEEEPLLQPKKFVILQ